MKLSTKGRYGLRALIDLAQNGGEQPVSITSISTRQDISERYLEQLMSMLKKAGIVRSVRGAQGGYTLTRRPDEYTVGMILRLTEGSLAPVACLEKKPNRCPKAAECKTLQMWEGFEKLVNDYFGNITIADLVNSNVGIDSYII